MTMRRAWPVAVVLGVLLVLGLVGGSVDSGAASQPSAQPTTAPLTGAVQVCPGAEGVAAASADAVAVALADIGVEPDTDGALALVTLPRDDEVPRTVASTSSRGETLEARARSAIIARGDGGLAPGVAAQSLLAAARARTAGLASVTCPEPSRDAWFVGGSGQVGERAALVLANPSDAPAVVDVSLWSDTGPLQAGGTQDLGIPPRGSRLVSVDALALGARRLAVHVDVVLGRVGATMVLREVSGADPQGVTWVTPSVPPTRLSYVPGLPADGDRTLRLLNPGEADAIVSVRALGVSGPFTPLGLEAIDAPAGQVVDVDLDVVGDEVVALEVTSSEPVVSAARVEQASDDELSDLAVVGSADTLDTAGSAWVDSEDGRVSQVLLTALPERRSDLPTPAATPAASPAATPDASPTATPDAATPPGSPTPPATPDATPSPTQPTSTPDAATPTPDAPVEPDADVLTTQVVVRLVDKEGSPLGAQVVTLVRGSTLEVPVDLPDGVTAGWVVVEPVDTGAVLAARATTATVAVPDPLAPDEDREGQWLDVVPIVSSTLTVQIPPVLADLTAGLPGQSSSAP